MGKIVLFVGPSASGKDTIIRTLFKESVYKFEPIILHTTRPIRNGEINGVDYFFDTKEVLDELTAKNKIIESRCYNTVYGDWYYYTVSENLDISNNNYLGSNALIGLDKYIEYFQEDNIISILIKTDSDIRLTRALNREKKEQNPKYQEMCRRFIADSEDFSDENIKKRPITAIIDNNKDMKTTLKEVDKVLSLHL